MRRNGWESSGTAALVVLLLALSVSSCGQDTYITAGAPQPEKALIVVSPHPDDESILGGGTIYRMAADPAMYVRAIYMSSGDRASVPGDCHGIPEAQKTQMIIDLREGETRKAWAVLAPTRDVPIDFLRGPDMGLVASSTLVNGVRQDVLSPAGERAVQGAVQIITTELPASVRQVLILTTSKYDGHPDHRTAYRAARMAAEALHNDRQIDVTIWSWIVHDEVGTLTNAPCCAGDFHWPAAGPHDDYLALVDTPVRPRPPVWNHVEDITDVMAIRNEALSQHASQVVGNPALCMPVYIPSFYERWMEKTEEPFYVETIGSS